MREVPFMACQSIIQIKKLENFTRSKFNLSDEMITGLSVFSNDLGTSTCN